MNDNDANIPDLSSMDASTTIENIRSRLLWNDIVYRIRVKGEHKHNRRCVSDSLCPELTIGQYEELIIEQLKLEKAHPNLNPHSQTYHPMSGFICGLNDSDSKVDQDYLSDFTEFLLDPDDNPGDCENWLRGLIFDFRSADSSHFQSLLENQWSDYAMNTFPGWWKGLGTEKQNVVLVELFHQQKKTGKSSTPKYVIGIETLLDDGTLDGYEDESGKIMALYEGNDTEIYHCLLIFKRSDIGITATKRIFRRLS